MGQYGLDASQYAPLGVPVGTIVAFAGSITSLPDGWVVCNGQTVHDAASWFNGQKVPLICDNLSPSPLNASTHLAGVNTPDVVNTPFGRNDIPSHSHGNSTGTEKGLLGPAGPDGFQKEGHDCHVHQHAIAQEPVGENRPYSLGVWFIIRIK
jgi:hypothetical protein